MNPHEQSATDEKALEVAREVMARRRKALRALAQTELANQIMREDEAILRDLAK